MNTNTTNQSENSPSDDPQFAAIPELRILSSDGSWKPIAACVARPEQFEGTLSSTAIERFIDSARRSNLALERVLAAIRQNWNA